MFSLDVTVKRGQDDSTLLEWNGNVSRPGFFSLHLVAESIYRLFVRYIGWIGSLFQLQSI